MIRFIQIEIMTSPILKDARFQRGKNDRWTRLNCSLSPFLWATIYENIIHKNMDMTFWPTYLLKLCPNFFSLKNMVWANPTYLWFGICPNFRSFFFWTCSLTLLLHDMTIDRTDNRREVEVRHIKVNSHFLYLQVKVLIHQMIKHLHSPVSCVGCVG